MGELRKLNASSELGNQKIETIETIKPVEISGMGEYEIAKM